jgi:endonuclease/exonuclease/phosphatase family metal-dependent hydrolase
MSASDLANTENKEPWHFDKRIPVALLFTLLVQTFLAGALIARMDSRITELETRARSLEEWKDGTQGKLDLINVTLGRVDERMQAQADILREIKDALKRR